MSSTALSVYPHLPPTSNLLNSQQRSRLLRSTRKLGAVLGTTPYVLENDTSFTIFPFGKSTSRTLKRQGSVFTHKQPSSSSISTVSSSHSTSSINLTQSVAQGMQSANSHPTNPPGLSGTHKGRTRVKPPPLCLQLNLIPVSATNDHLLSPLPSPRTTPPTPTTPVPDVAAIRRKRMAKLARHLGENVPVELVFSSDPAPKPPTVSPDRYQRRRSQSVHVLSDDAVRVCDNRTPHMHSHSTQEWVGEWNRANIRDVQSELRNLKIR